MTPERGLEKGFLGGIENREKPEMIMKKFTLPAFKKEPAKKKKEDLIKDVSYLYQQFQNVKEYYKSQYGDTISDTGTINSGDATNANPKTPKKGFRT